MPYSGFYLFARVRKMTHSTPAWPASPNIIFKYPPAMLDALRDWMQDVGNAHPEWRK
jgi:hypothetical protein